jgi:hypothetical protein
VDKPTSYKNSMGGAGSSETLAQLYQTTWHRILKDSTDLDTPDFVHENRWQNINYDCHLLKPLFHLLWM